MLNIGKYDEPDHEAEFYHHWLAILKANQGLTRGELSVAIGKMREFPNGVGTLMRSMCELTLISPLDAEWLLQQLPDPSFSLDQVRAIVILQDEKLTWMEKLEAVVPLNAVWAAGQLLQTMALEDEPRAREVIKLSRQPRNLRHALEDVLNSKYRVKSENW
ncbi:MAG: hypothetical protein ABJA67_14230 [Chthonomonadales bacterium]